MKNSQDRLFEALDYGKGQKAKLTKKQYLVYSYLMTISKWDAQDKERHYYVYKNSLTIKDACQTINISQPTWRTAIKKLIDFGYIQEYNKYFTIDTHKTYVPLNIELIKFLLTCGVELTNGGNIIGVYSTIYKYWKLYNDNNDICEITINQLRALFDGKTDKNTLMAYRIMLGLFIHFNLIDVQLVSKQLAGKFYTIYVIKDVKLKMDNSIEANNDGHNIKDVIKMLEQQFSI